MARHTRSARGFRLSSLLALALVVPLPARAGDERPAPSAEELLEGLRGDDLAGRTRALEQLRKLGDKARPVLRRALRDPDPDVRFYALQLLNLPSGKLVRGLRDVVEQAAEEGDGSAIRTFEALAKAATAETPGRLIQLVRRELRMVGRSKPLMAVVALDLLCEVLPRFPSPAHAPRLATLLERDAGAAFHGLTMAFGVLPYDQALPALRSVLNGGSDPARIRAALVLGQVSDPAHARQASAALTPLLKHKSARVRLAGVQAIDLLALPPSELIPVARRVTDRSSDVAAEAIRIAGERKLKVARDPCLALVQDARQPLSVRKQAARCLGLLGNPASAATLRALTKPGTPRELRVLCAWALGAVHAPDALEVLVPLIQGPDFSQEQPLYNGVARYGGAAGRAALFEQIRMPKEMPGARDAVILLRGRAARALRAAAGLQDPTTSRELAELFKKPRAPRSYYPGPTGAEARLVLEALAKRGDDESRTLLGSLLLEADVSEEREACLELLSRVGMPKGSYPLKARVVEELQREVRRGRRTRSLAADALARVDPATARTFLRAQRFGSSRTLRDLARSLARAGDPSLIARYALPVSRNAVRMAPAGRRVDELNNVGIDLLYAGEYQQALMTFRRMTWSQPEHYLAAYNAACAYSLQGKVEPALRCLRQSVFQLGYKNPPHMVADTDLTNLRPDPRFKRMLSQLRLAAETQMGVPELTLPARQD